MNLLLLLPSDFTAPNLAKISGRRFDHAVKVLKTTPGDTLTVGVLNGKTGKAKVLALNSETLEIKVLELSTAPPPALPVSLILGLPRPQMLKRILQTVATLGVDTLHLLQTARVEKSFWQTPSLTDQAVQEQLILGLEQGKATQLPKVYKHKRFTPFVEDVLPSLAGEATHKFIAHPSNSHAPATLNTPTLLAIGPEGGFLDQEVRRFLNHQFAPLSLGPRILKVETAVPVALAQLFL